VGMKGIVLTLDSIIALLIMITVISLLIFFRTETISPFFTAQQLHSLSEDALTILSESTLREVTNQTLLNYFIQNGVLNQSDLDKKAIDVIGALWSANKPEAANISKDILNDIVPDNIGYQVLINGDNIYNSSDTTRPSYNDATVEISSARIASGYEKYKPTSGYVARALARAVKKNNTLVVMGDVITTSVQSSQNRLNVTYIADIPDDATILDTYWFIEAAWATNKFSCYMNGNKIAGCEGSIGNTKLYSGDYKQWMISGRNIANVIFKYAAGTITTGDDGATHLVIVYNTSKLSTLEDYGKQYFQSVTSNASIEYEKPIFVPGNISEMAVRLNVVNGTSVNNVTLSLRWNGVNYKISSKVPVDGIAQWNNTEIKNVLNSNGISYNILKGRFFWFIADIDTYHRSEPLGYGREINGSDSYVSINYTALEEIYNYIDITRILTNFTYSNSETCLGLSDFYRYSRWNFNLTNKIPLFAKWQFAWGYCSQSPPPKQLVIANNIVLYNSSINPFIYAFARFGYDTDPQGILISSDNKFELNFTTGYAVNTINSLGEATFLIPASVSYNGIFETNTSAENDANQRLRSILGEDVSATEIVNQSYSVAGVPYMWGPVSVRIRMWI